MKKNKFQKASVLAIIGFFALILCLSVAMTLKNTSDLTGILEDSVKAQLISISTEARGLIDIDKFDSYNSREDVEADAEAYAQTLENLRDLQAQVGATFIYALKQVDREFCFVFDTDTEDDTIFEVYEGVSEVHKDAFLGKNSAGIMNVVDEWGKFNTGAVPIMKNGKIIGAICTDVEDEFIATSAAAARTNAIILTIVLLVAMCVMTFIITGLLKNLQKTQDKLFNMANYDVITGLPNRQYLLSYLQEISVKAIKTDAPFALFFIDLDNFKRVNDNAGHDAGDELLQQIATYLNTVHENSKSFRPAAGILNISARIGGDEFVQIVPGVSTQFEAELVAKKLFDNFSSQTLDRFIEKYQVGLSVGVALFPHHTNNYNVLIKYADLAMYHAKKNGKNTYCIYTEELSQKE